MHAVVVAASNPNAQLDAFPLTDADLLLAVDGGAELLVRAGVVPAMLVGDMDSVSSDTRALLEAQGVQVVLLPTAKDQTDTEVALRIAVQKGADRITIYGALGGERLDHLVGNLLLLTSPWLEGVHVRLADDLHEAFLVQGDAVVAGRRNEIVSLFPLTPVVEDVRTEGLLYPLTGERLLRSATRGISNVMTGAEARVTHGNGELLLVHYRGR